MDSQQKSKLLAKNTIILYLRMMCTMFIALYTSRVILNALGIDEYGLYNVIAGIVTMLTIVTAGLATSTQRFLSYELGKHDHSEFTKVFSLCLVTHILLVFIIIILSESVGIWFLNTYLQVPDGRLEAANWIFQFSIITISLNVLATPYIACIISHEKMGLYAYLGVFDAVLKLIIALAISTSVKDRLVLYGALLMILSLVDLLIYIICCRKLFKETHFRLIWDKSFFKEIFAFSSWTMLGQGGIVVANQGNNILINIFHKVAANAALGIANQVNTAISSLTSSFFTAFQPQITKSYSCGDYGYLTQLLNWSSKLSYFLIFILAIPFIFNIDIILKIWLGTVPDYTSSFCVVFIISSMVNALGNPFWTALFANGNIKQLQFYSLCFYVFDIIILLSLFAFGFPPITAPLTKLSTDICITVIRILLTKKHMPFISIKQYISDVLSPICITSLIVVSLGLILKSMHSNLILDIIFSGILAILSLLVIFYVGLSSNERTQIIIFIKSKLSYSYK